MGRKRTKRKIKFINKKNKTINNIKNMARKHNEDEVLRTLRSKNDVRIVSGEIQVLKDKVYNKKTCQVETNPKKHFDLGNGSWGKISFLVNYCGYRQIFVSKF